MSYQANKKKYIKTMFSFVRHELDGPKFVRKFFKLWKADRDAEWALLDDQTVPERSDLELKFIDVIDSIFTACDAFNVDPKEEWELDEERLRSFVVERLESYVLVIV